MFILFITPPLFTSFFFFFNDTATTEIYTLSLHDALPISCGTPRTLPAVGISWCSGRSSQRSPSSYLSCDDRSEEHTSELQSRPHLVCRLLLEKKKKNALRSTSSTSLRGGICAPHSWMCMR